jgi:hypothetical protein
MEILVNGKPIEFELEGGETLKEIISSLNEWVYKGGNTITDLKIDGEKVEFDEAARSTRSVDEIKTIEMEIRMPEELALSSMEDAVPYLRRLLDGIDDVKEISKFREFIDGLEWFKEVCKRSESVLKLEYGEIYIDNRSIEARMSEYEEMVGLLRRKVNDKDLSGGRELLKTETKPILEDWIKVVPQMIERIPQEIKDKITGLAQTTLLERLNKAIDEIPGISKRLETVSLDLQTGNEHRAMESFQEITEELSDMIHLLQETERNFGLDYRSIRVEDQTVHERALEMDELLSEIITAFENKDIVMLSDLLEYELSPAIQRWKDVLKTIFDQIKIGIH